MNTSVKLIQRLQNEKSENHKPNFAEWEKSKKQYELDLKKWNKKISDFEKEIFKKDLKLTFLEKDDENYKTLDDEISQLETKVNFIKSEKPSCPEEPELPRQFILNDATPEALGLANMKNPKGFLYFTDELVGFFAGFKKNGREDARSFFLTSWAGDQSYSDARVTRDGLVIDNLCLSILGTIQPGPLAQIFLKLKTNLESADGMMQRFQLMVWPDISKEYDDTLIEIDVNVLVKVFEIFKSLAELEGNKDGFDDSGIGIHDEHLKDQSAYLNFTYEAQEHFNSWHKKLAIRLRNMEDEPDEIKAHLNKYRSLIPSLALILYLVEGGRKKVDLWSLEKAIMWGEYLELHARRIYSLCGDNEFGIKRLAKKLIKDEKLKDGFTARDVDRKQWKGLTESKSSKQALDILTEKNG